MALTQSVSGETRVYTTSPSTAILTVNNNNLALPSQLTPAVLNAALNANTNIGTITPNGNSQATATPIASKVTICPSVATGTGLILVAKFNRATITNADASNSLTVYPPVGGFINNNSTNTGVTIVAGDTATFTQNPTNSLQWISS